MIVLAHDYHLLFWLSLAHTFEAVQIHRTRTGQDDDAKAAAVRRLRVHLRFYQMDVWLNSNHRCMRFRVGDDFH